MSRMSTGTSSQAAVRCTASMKIPASTASAKPTRARDTPSEASCRPTPGFAREVATTTISRAPTPMGRIRRSSVSRVARACRRAASDGAVDAEGG